MIPAGRDAILRRLDELRRGDAELPWALEFNRRLLRLQDDAGRRWRAPRLQSDLGEETIRGRLRSGRRVFDFYDLDIQWESLPEVCCEVVVLFDEARAMVGPMPADVLWFVHSPGWLKRAARDWYDSVGSSDGGAVQETLLRQAIIHATLQPFLLAHRDLVSGLTSSEEWRLGYCPVCGGSPDFASLDRAAGARRLLCSRCDAEWPFTRLECPYCGCHEQGNVSYFTNADERYRVYVCDRCRHYLKTIDLRCAPADTMMPLERLMTSFLDAQAMQEGYTPCLGRPSA